MQDLQTCTNGLDVAQSSFLSSDGHFVQRSRICWLGSFGRGPKDENLCNIILNLTSSSGVDVI